ncbi:MAG: DUF1848 domain-containing protein [Spirochaetes bacterium]|nr:DUF1848 domain-containing protein [Spirochaetota bacterium]
MKHIISASRRTDIPAFYSDWFINRIKEGVAWYRNPMFPEKAHRVSLKVEDVLAFVFWSKSYTPFLSHLQIIKDMGYKAIFHFTINNYPKVLESNVPDISTSISAARCIVDLFGAESLIWRYDPIIHSNITDFTFHEKNFALIAHKLKGLTSRCVFSYVNRYRKVDYEFKQLEKNGNISVQEISLEGKRLFAHRLSAIANANGIALYSCCDDSLVSGDIQKAHCIDADHIDAISRDKQPVKMKPTRTGCGCYESRDIGAYDTCIHGCAYCYANTGKETAVKYHQTHDPLHMML